MKERSGFTIIEITLFFAISGFLIIGLIVGTGATISRQRYNDSVQDFSEFLRRQYSEVINVENGRTIKEKCNNSTEYQGRTNCLIYGRLITFGSNPGEVKYYTVVGNDLGDKALESPTTLDALVAAKLFIPSSAVRGEYRLQWSAKAEQIEPSKPFKASILIVRSPQNGSIYTYVLDNEIVDAGSHSSSAKPILKLASGNSITPNFRAASADICIGSDDIFAVGGKRRNVRLHKDGRNSTAVELIALDNEKENQCK